MPEALPISVSATALRTAVGTVGRAIEMPMPATAVDRPYHKDQFRIDKDGYVNAPTEPGLGYPIDHDALDKIMKRVDR